MFSNRRAFFFFSPFCNTKDEIRLEYGKDRLKFDEIFPVDLMNFFQYRVNHADEGNFYLDASIGWKEGWRMCLTV